MSDPLKRVQPMTIDSCLILRSDLGPCASQVQACLLSGASVHIANDAFDALRILADLDARGLTICVVLPEESDRGPAHRAVMRCAVAIGRKRAILKNAQSN